MKKYYCKQVNPEFAESWCFNRFTNATTKRSYLEFNDEFYANNVILTGNKDYLSVYPDGLEDLQKKIEWFSSDLVGYNGFQGNLTELANWYFKKHNEKRWSKRELASWRRVSDLTENYSKNNEEEAFLLALKLITGKTWNEICIKGDCQGDWQTGYASEEISQEDINYIEMCFFNTGAEYLIYEGYEHFKNEEADTSMYIDSYGAKQTLAKMLGVKEKNLVVYDFDGYDRTPRYVLAQ